jgi:ABC-2 type transport system ATP-binding protein
MRLRPTLPATALAVLLTGGALLPATTAAEAAPGARSAPKVTHGCLDSVPEPGTTEPVEICYTLFRPAGATRKKRVPMILHSHGWGGSRTQDPAAFRTWLDHGYGVLSFDQRGFGESGGKAHVENPRFEGKDDLRIVRFVSRLTWVKQDRKGDPRMGAIGGSYGGGYQFLTAFESQRRSGRSALDAIAPEITWHDLNTSLAPRGVVRAEWALALSAAALPTDALPPEVMKALAEGIATGMWPDGSIPGTEDMRSFFERNGPRWQLTKGRRLSIPALIGQGTTDTLFPLEQGLTNWRRAFTRKARAKSIFVGYNGGHVLPAVLPQGVTVSSDPCSERLAGGDFTRLTRLFFDRHLKGRDVRLKGRGRIHLATPGSTCTTVRSVAPTKRFRVGTVATTETGGVPLAYEIAKGPIRLAGNARFSGKLTALGVMNRAFYGLGVGTTPLDAELVQNNVLPLNELEPVVGEQRKVRLPAVAVDVPEGQSLFLIASPVSDTFLGMGSRTPGAVVFEDTVVELPVIGG